MGSFWLWKTDCRWERGIKKTSQGALTVILAGDEGGTRAAASGTRRAETPLSEMGKTGEGRFGGKDPKFSLSHGV